MEGEEHRVNISELADYLRIPREEAYALAAEGKFPPRPVLWGDAVIFSRAWREVALDRLREEDHGGDAGQREG